MRWFYTKDESDLSDIVLGYGLEKCLAPIQNIGAAEKEVRKKDSKMRSGVIEGPPAPKARGLP